MARKSYCDGVTRRDFVHVGTASLFGLGLGLPELLAAQSQARQAGQPTRDVSVIFLFLKGGLSTIDTWDMKPDAPAEFRGEFGQIATNVPGIQVCEHLPLSSQVQDRFSLVRSTWQKSSDHGPGDHYMLTGYHPLPRFN